MQKNNILNILDDIFDDKGWEEFEKEEAKKLLDKWISNKDNIKWVKETLNKIISNNTTTKRDDYFKEDFIQDLYIILSQTNPSKLIKLLTGNTIRFFISKVILNNIKSNTSKYYKNYIQPIELQPTTKEINNLLNIEDKEYKEDNIDDINNFIIDFYKEYLHQADSLIFTRYYIEGLTLKQISKIYNVSLSFIFLSIRRVKTILLYSYSLTKMSKEEIDIEIQKTIKIFDQTKKPNLMDYHKSMMLYNLLNQTKLINTMSKLEYKIIKNYFLNFEIKSN